jgi:gluconokinase
VTRRGVLALDLGSSSVRAGLVGADGELLVAGVRRPYRLETAADGRSQVDADELVRLLASAIDEALAVTPPGLELAGVAMSTMWHSVCGVDRYGRATTPVLTWADRRASQDARDLRERLDERAFHRRTGCTLHSSYLPARLRWLARTQPGVVERTAGWVSPGEYALLRFCGAARVSTSMASGTGLMDLRRADWDAEALGAAGIDAWHLAELSDAPLDGLRGDWASRWPALARLPWFPAVGDGACSNVGCGALGTGRAALMVGTSGALRVAWRGEAVDPPEGLWCYRAGGGRFVMGGALSNGGNVARWVRDTLRLAGDDLDAAEAAIAGMTPLATGLTVLPLLAGERGPGYADDARGAIAGLSLATTPVDLLRATLEGVAMRFALISDLLEGALPGTEELLATGAGMRRSPAWRQIMADALARPVTESLVDEASTRGAGLLALEALGEIESVEDVGAPAGATLAPDPQRHAAYREAMKRQAALYDLTVGG